MARYRILAEADADIEKIYPNGIETWGLAQARNYLHGLHERFEFLALIIQTSVSIRMNFHPVGNGFVMTVMVYSLSGAAITPTQSWRAVFRIYRRPRG